ncbi:hypothetical protein LCGC14_2824010 [marine sediment metagenome]|uniref:Uncharacterized protein n=1 Tax=marine sediment metagenome TaxID=412755 RepID=A0A0F8YG83_9ZZZZ
MSLDAQHQDTLIEWLSAHTPQLHDGAYAYLCAMQNLDAPHVRMRPAIYIDGNKWCALYGKNIQDGVAGFGDSPEAACAEFDKAWLKGLMD